MKIVGLTYSDGESFHSADRFLSKDELRGIFPESDGVSLCIQYKRRYFCKKGGDPEGRKKGSKKKKKKKGYGIASREKSRFKHRCIWL